MVKNINKQNSVESEVSEAVNRITVIIEKYTDQIELLDIIDIVDNLRVIVEIAERARAEHKNVNVA
ncbi:MAG: hypothetical protein ACOY40_07225 [Bacillota bacterium]